MPLPCFRGVGVPPCKIFRSLNKTCKGHVRAREAGLLFPVQDPTTCRRQQTGPRSNYCLSEAAELSKIHCLLAKVASRWRWRGKETGRHSTLSGHLLPISKQVILSHHLETDSSRRGHNGISLPIPSFPFSSCPARKYR
ncbi:hypothetical protein NA56DRAFT_160681 [Hyaloscypha hepaticicola]|uniref:Uncharacterized protein n=1 Tax=Hyaloscypha hepaticicola TaxID=2082293 RepID=A0A2J6Q3T3_9HELO|nr:hypothetical protein NA56DRAFT_160681 [Hyaloscypha hepaticicola]